MQPDLEHRCELRVLGRTRRDRMSNKLVVGLAVAGAIFTCSSLAFSQTGGGAGAGGGGAAGAAGTGTGRTGGAAPATNPGSPAIATPQSPPPARTNPGVTPGVPGPSTATPRPSTSAETPAASGPANGGGAAAPAPGEPRTRNQGAACSYERCTLYCFASGRQFYVRATLNNSCADRCKHKGCA